MSAIHQSKVAVALLLMVLFFSSGLPAQNSWTRYPGPYGGNIGSITKDRTGTIWITSSDQRIFKFSSPDEELIPVNEGLPVRDLASDSYNHLYAATSYGVFKSTDNGESWQAANNGFPQDYSYRYINKILVRDNDHIFACTNYHGVYRSTDHGASWAEINIGLDWPCVNAIAVDSLGNLYVASYKEFYYSMFDHFFKYGIFFSSNNGDTWELVYEAASTIWSLAVDRSGHVYAGLWSGGVLESPDHGQSWNRLGLSRTTIFSLETDDQGRLYAGTYDDTPYENRSLGIVYRLVQDTLWEQIFPVTDSTFANSPISSLMCTSVRASVNTSENILFIGASRFNWGGIGDGLFYFDLDRNECTHIGLTVNVVSIGSDLDGDLYASTDNGSFKRNRSNNRWSKICKDSGIFLFNSKGDIFLYFGSVVGILQSTDHGKTWTKIYDDYIGRMGIDDRDNIFLSTFSNVIRRSQDNGAHWDSLQAPVPNDVCAFGFKDSLVFIGVNAAETSLYRSRDLGDSWQPCQMENTYILTFLTNSEDELFALTWDKVLKSTDDGLTWEIAANLQPNVGCFVADRNDNLYVGSQGIVRLENGIFTAVDEGLNDCFVGTLAIYNDTLIAATDRGLFCKPLEGTDHESSPDHFFLHQNYPNPFNSGTKIQYWLRHPGFVTLKLYDVLGKEITVLVDEQKTAGDQEVEFDGKDLPSGVYLYRMAFGNFTKTSKFVLLR